MRSAISQLLCAAVILLGSGIDATAETRPDLSQIDQARFLRASGEYDAAIDILRQLLRAHPKNTGVREELGYVLILDGQMAAAQYQFEILRERSSDPQLRGLYSAVLRRIIDERPVGVSLIFGATPTSNINNGTDNSVLGREGGDIAAESRRISGWHGRIGLRGYVRGNVGEKGRVVFDWRAQRYLYSTLYEPETETEFGLSYSQVNVQSDFGVRVFRTDRQRERGDYNRTGVTFSGGKETGIGKRINGFLQFSTLNVEDNDSKEDLQTVLDVGYTLTPTPAFAYRFGFQAARVNANADIHSYSSLAATLQVNAAFRGGYEVSSQMVAGARHFDQDLDFTRKDSFADISVTVFNSQFSVGGIVPKLTCTLGATKSNVALFEVDTRACGVSLSRRF